MKSGDKKNEEIIINKTPKKPKGIFQRLIEKKHNALFEIKNQSIVILCVLVLALCFTSLFINKLLFSVEAVVAIAIFVFIFFTNRNQRKQNLRYLTLISKSMNTTDDSISSLPMPVLMVNEKLNVLWYNNFFRNDVVNGVDVLGHSLKEVVPNTPINSLLGETIDLQFGEKSYSVYTTCTKGKGVLIYVMYFFDNTELKLLKTEHALSRPTVSIVVIDNLEEILQNAKESDKASVYGSIDKVLEKWIGDTTGVVIKKSRERFVLVMEERHMAQSIENKFPVLDEIRKISVDGRMVVTMSIGVGRGGETFRECEEMASQALDMALGRGGDQAAIHTKDGYEFFGGVSTGVEKRNKVRSRIIATALNEIIENSEVVLIMGHKSSDLDCVGSSVGLCYGIRSKGVKCHIVVDREQSMARPLIDKIETEISRDIFINEAEALEIQGDNSLVIIVDTHNEAFIESDKVYKNANNVVIIDHHRKMVNHINNAVIFFHENYASSASEMVTELVQYLKDARINSEAANALLAGIMLDTKNFTLKTGVRTFEAAAYLKRQGADTVFVRKLFSESIETYRRKSNMVASAIIYKENAISISKEQGDDMRLSAAQAADELLLIEGVKASFVVYQEGNRAIISARSLGEVNVQLIMEQLGGGGHLTMAGAQIDDVNIDDAEEVIKNAIDKYLEQKLN